MRINCFAACGLVLTALGVVGCGNDDPVSTADLIADVIEEVLLLDAEDALALANEWRTSKPGVTCTLTADAVEFALSDGEGVSVPLPVDTMVLAVAPYLTETHPCEIHSISGCLGELAGVEMWVLAQDAAGTVLIDETMTAMDNGFIELWLPRNSEIDLTIEAEGKTATGSVSTYDTSNTCIPHLKLE